ncbi:MAG: diaminopimelate epimerase, partial [Sphingomonas sp.]|nr:diaminopimelate epimerase [Sphingomonas sp.]
MTRQFHKMHGLGNDFVILDGREEAVAMTPARARAITDRRTGVGCDQLIILTPSHAADLKMEIWNADGSIAEACGNASRCVVRLTGVATIETAGGIIGGSCEGGEIEVSLGLPGFGWEDIPLAYPMDCARLPLAWDELAEPMAVNLGNPHVVFFVTAIDEQRLAELGPRIEHDDAFPERVNVNVASVHDGVVTLRTW